MQSGDGPAGGRGHVRRVVRHYLPDTVYGANDGVITTFAVVSGVVRGKRGRACGAGGASGCPARGVRVAGSLMWGSKSS